MKKEEELALKVTKEIVVKFIEVGRLSANSFAEVWGQIYDTVRGSLTDPASDPSPPSEDS